MAKTAANHNTVTDRRWQWYVQPLSPAVSHGNESQNTNSLSANYLYMCLCASYHYWPLFEGGVYLAQSFRLCGYYLRAVFDWWNAVFRVGGHMHNMSRLGVVNFHYFILWSFKLGAGAALPLCVSFFWADITHTSLVVRPYKQGYTHTHKHDWLGTYLGMLV